MPRRRPRKTEDLKFRRQSKERAQVVACYRLLEVLFTVPRQYRRQTEPMISRTSQEQTVLATVEV
jgi:hypothetical protein